MKRLAFTVVLLIGVSILSYTQSGKNSKPNIIFILMDDLGYGDLGAFFQNQRKAKGDRSKPYLFTPQLDKIAAEGAMLTNHYAAAPVCAPSRASLLLGLSQGHANVRDNQFDKELENNYTLGNVLKDVGYKTAAIGKWGLQGKDTPAPNWPAHPLKRGFDYFFGYIAHGDGHEHYPKEGIYRSPKKVWENYEEISSKLDKCYTGDLFTAVAKKYIIEHVKDRKANEPFFMYLAYDTPHAVLELATQAYPAGGGLKGGVQWLGKPSMMINTASGEPDSYMYPQYANATYDHDKDPSTPEVPWPDTYKRFASVVHRIDDQIGDLIQLLKDLNIDKNTLVIFSSDNGPSKESYLPKSYVSYEANFFDNYGPFTGIKRDCLEGGLRTPTIAWWPSVIRPGTIVDAPSISYDWMPTFTEVAGYYAPVRSDGISLLPALTGKGQQAKSQIYVEYFHPSAAPKYAQFSDAHRNRRRDQMQMIRLGDTVGVRYNIQSAEDNFEIYDVSKDPQQIVNLAQHLPELQRYMKERVLQMRVPQEDAPRPYDEALIPSVSVKPVKKGVSLTTYQVNTSWIPQVQNLKIRTEKIVNNLSVPADGNLAVFSGWIKAPVDGTYQFFLSASDKAFFKIHDAGIIDADFGYKAGTEKTTTVKLKAGYHPITIYYLKKEGSKNSRLSFLWSYEGQAKQPVPIANFFN